MEYFYLDIGRMIRRLQQKPDEFEIRNKCIQHRPTRHRLIFERDGKGRIVARCNRVDFPVSREQGVALRVAVENWEGLYSRPPIASDPIGRLLRWINPALARYFGPGTKWRQAIDAAWAWVAVTVTTRSRPSPKPRLRIVSARADDAGFPGDTCGETRAERDQKIAAFRQIAENGHSTSPTSSSRQKRRL
jgi:hypothetical protein